MANKKRRNNNRKVEEARSTVPAEFLDEDTREDIEEEFEEEFEAEPEPEKRVPLTESEKQRREDRQNLLLLLGVIAVLAVVGIVIWVTSGSSDKSETAVAGTTTQPTEIAAADTNEEKDVLENGTEEAVNTEEAEEALATQAETDEDIPEEEIQPIETEEESGTEAVAGAETGEETDAGNGEEAPAEAEQTEAPAEAEQTETPAEAEQTETPAGAEQTETPAGTEQTEAPATEVTSTTVLEKGTVYTFENPMKLYEEASTDSAVVMDLNQGWICAIEEPAEAGNGWHRVSVWLGGSPTYGYIQIP